MTSADGAQKRVTICVLGELRMRRNRMTLTELSERTKITLAALSRLDSGKTARIEFTTIDELCDALECEPGDLFRRVSPEEATAYFRRSFDNLAPVPAA